MTIKFEKNLELVKNLFKSRVHYVTNSLIL